MPVYPKSFYTFLTGLATTKTAKKLRKNRHALKAQQNAYQELIGQLTRTKYGREAGLHGDIPYERFQQYTPLQTYATIRPLIERMQLGEADVLWPGQCHLYARSAGATAGHPKILPITEAMLDHLRTAFRTSVLHYTARVGHAGIFRGRHLFHHHSSSALRSQTSSANFITHETTLAGLAIHHFPDWVEKHYYEPGKTIATIEDPRKRRHATAKHARLQDITLLGGHPQQLLKLATTVCKAATKGKARPLNLQGVWPNLECVMHGGDALGFSRTKLRRACGPEVQFHEIYSSVEGVIAAQDADASHGLRLITDAGLFYEFLPLAEYREDDLHSMGSHARPLSEVKSDVDYVLILTTPAGLCRYVTGDIVRFTSATHHRLTLQGRTELRLNSFGENVLERELTDTLVKVCHDHAWVPINFHVAPLLDNKITGEHSGRHEWWIELEPGTVDTPTGPILSAAIDQELRRQNRAYNAKRASGVLAAPEVRLVIPGVFAHWLQHNGKWHPQGKFPLCHQHREIADGLAQLARFTRRT